MSKITVWITRYALTSGVIKRQAEVCSDVSDGMISVGANGCFHKPDWHTSEDEALARFLEMKVARISSLERSLKRVNGARFRVKEVES